MTDPPRGLDRPGIYIHIPFCRTRCAYCGFPTTDRSDPQRIERYLDALIREIETAADTEITGSDTIFDTIYLGGGTPSLLTESQIERLMGAVIKRFPMDSCPEITIEANPGDIQPARVRHWIGLGFNRISLGIQALDDPALQLLGRRHTAARAVAALTICRDTDLILAADLIFGFPGHLPEAWRHTLTAMIEYAPEHLSCYQMTLDPGTPMATAVKTGTLTPVGENMEVHLFNLTHEVLIAAGYDHYEVSNFARKPEHIARHNTKYWLRTPYLGLGAAAHSFDGSRRWSNHRDIDAYCCAIETGRKPVAATETIGPDETLRETIFLGLRTRWGIPCDRLPRQLFSHIRCRQLIDSGYLEQSAGRLRPREKGFTVADAIASELMMMCEPAD